MPFPRFRSSCALVIVLALAACNAASQGMPPLNGDSGTPGGSDASSVARPDAHPADAMPADAGSTSPDATRPSGDAGGTGGTDAGSSGGGDGIISCYTEGNPGATCTLPTHCCFSNYSSQHDGACSTSACIWGTVECDGPEDCASGQHCCAHALFDSDSTPSGYLLACQASACGAAPANQEMCHPTTSSAAGTCSSPSSRCVTAFGNDNDLPANLHICQ